MIKITFIIPCYNFEEKIILNHDKITKFIKSKKIRAKIIYIDDASNDKTFDQLKSIKNKKNIIFIKNKFNQGKSLSIRKALKKVETENVVLIDCDLPYFDYLEKVINEVRKNDFVSINRRLYESKNIEKTKNFYQYIRGLISSFFGFIIEARLNLKVFGDTQAGLKAFKINKKLKNNNFISNYYFLDIELIHFFKKNKKRIKLIPVKYKISKNSNIKLFSLKNINIIFELIKVLIFLKPSLNS